ncbi:MAG: hypothetical protein LBJ14_00650 [Desulfarculales bacterium]|jgi:hypothetical protein|nr:hypothetical protein [Desulfarculales bacterium]
MRKLPFLFSVLLWLGAGCGAMYVDPGENPARLQVRAEGCLDAREVLDFVELQVLGPDLFQRASYYGTIQGPRWSIRAYIPAADGPLPQLRPTGGGLYDGRSGFSFAGQREFLLPQGEYPVEIWLEAYIYYCTDLLRGNCGLVTVNLWRETIAENSFAPGQIVSAFISGNGCAINRNVPPAPLK